MKNYSTHNFFNWALVKSNLIFILVGIFTLLLLVPSYLMEKPPAASLDPSGKIFDLMDKIGENFSPRTHIQTAILEAKNGDALSPDVLRELLINEQKLIEADKSFQLTPDNLEKTNFLYKYFNPLTNKEVPGIFSVAAAVESMLITHPKLKTSLLEASEEQVKFAIDAIMKTEFSYIITDAISIESTSKNIIVLGEEINWWISPALFINVFSDNEKLGGGVYSIGISSDESTINKEVLDRKIQDFLRGKQNTYNLWSIAIDVNLESEEQGTQSAIYITFTVIVALGIMGLALRSYWAVTLTGIGIGILIIWLKGLSILFNIKGGLTIDMIVPIAMISFGVDFAVHTIRRIQEEEKINIRKSYIFGMSGIITAIILAFLSNNIAFLANSISEIESVKYFGFSAAIAVTSAFFILGFIVPLAFAKITEKITLHWKNKKIEKLINFSLGSLVAIGTGSAIIVMIALNLILGTVILITVGFIAIILPILFTSKGEKFTKEELSENSSQQNNFSLLLQNIIIGLAQYKFITVTIFTLITIFFGWYAIKLEATFNVEDFFDPDSNIVQGLDKTDLHLGEKGGEPGIIYIEGRFGDDKTFIGIKDLLLKLSQNESIGRNLDGSPTFFPPNIISILEIISSSNFSKNEILVNTGIKITDEDLNGIPDNNEQIKLVLNYALEKGIFNNNGELIYTKNRIQDVLRIKDNYFYTQISFAIPGTRSLEKTTYAWESLNKDILIIKNTPNLIDYGITGSPFTRKAGLDATTKSLQLSIPIATLGTFLLLMIFMRSFRYSLITVIPILLVVIWLYGTMYLMSYGLNLVTATIGAISIGVGIDYSIHMTQRFREELNKNSNKFEALKFSTKGTGMALAASAASSIGGFLVMSQAPMPLFSSYGLITAIMIIMAFSASVLVLPSLLMIVSKNKTDIK